jgi:hypothetical protein
MKPGPRVRVKKSARKPFQLKGVLGASSTEWNREGTVRGALRHSLKLRAGWVRKLQSMSLKALSSGVSLM